MLVSAIWFGVLVSAVNWLQGALLGTVAIVVAVIAVASVGFMMLTGRINWRHRAAVILGCFKRGTFFAALIRPQMFAGVTYSFFVMCANLAASTHAVSQQGLSDRLIP